MSGICGIVHFDGRPIDPVTLQAMADAARHRGPDGLRIMNSAGIGLAHLALYDTPESTREVQPLTRGGVTVLADARIDNRDELIAGLGDTEFLSTAAPSDPELILAVFRRWGSSGIGRIVGDFAFAVWDERERTLHLARDPLGMRAIYYRLDGDGIVFGSEIRQLAAVPNVALEIHRPAVAAHLAGIAGPLASTFYENVAQVPPGCVLTADPRTQRVTSFWAVDPTRRISYRRDEDFAEHFLQIFERAVADRLRSVKPTGILLSGGLDSCSVASMAGWLSRRDGTPRPHAYSWAFDDFPECDERFISDHIVRHYRLPHAYVPVENAYPLEGYPAGNAPHFDEPFMGVYQRLHERTLERARADGVGVIMSGHRGDQMVGSGIFDYSDLILAGRWGSLVDEVRTHARANRTSFLTAFAKLALRPAAALLWPEDRLPALRRTLGGTRKTGVSAVQFPTWVTQDFAVDSELQPDEIDDGGALRPKGSRGQRYAAALAPVHMRVATWMARNAAQYQMTYADPWSDRRLLEFVVAVPQRVLNRAGEHKALTRRAMKGIMPEQARLSAAKILPHPLYEHGMTGPAKNTVLELLERPIAAEMGFLDAAALRAHFDDSVRTNRHHPNFWNALTLEMWLRGVQKFL